MPSRQNFLEPHQCCHAFIDAIFCGLAHSQLGSVHAFVLRGRRPDCRGRRCWCQHPRDWWVVLWLVAPCAMTPPIDTMEYSVGSSDSVRHLLCSHPALPIALSLHWRPRPGRRWWQHARGRWALGGGCTEAVLQQQQAPCSKLGAAGVHVLHHSLCVLVGCWWANAVVHATIPHAACRHTHVHV